MYVTKTTVTDCSRTLMYRTRYDNFQLLVMNEILYCKAKEKS